MTSVNLLCQNILKDALGDQNFLHDFLTLNKTIHNYISVVMQVLSVLLHVLPAITNVVIIIVNCRHRCKLKATL